MGDTGARGHDRQVQLQKVGTMMQGIERANEAGRAIEYRVMRDWFCTP